jgi:light-regulated signal transduction histidine kinase (bacteriophytochrome)
LQEASEELRNSNEELMRINLELDQFAYVVSHDLKAPLRAINNISTWLEEDLGEKLDDDSRNHLSLLRNRVARMDSMISGILAYSRAGRKKGNLMPVDLNLLLPEIIEILEIPPAFTLDIQAGLPLLFGDRTELLQAFTNLIGNAIKYHNRPDGKVSISFKKRGKFYFISVSDDGPGIPEEFHERIFGVFQRLEGRDEVEGTGVGLSIVRKIIESNGGKIKVKSKPGEGATFIFSWPVYRE